MEKLRDRLHADIMNIRAKSENREYREGHRDARHEAARIVSEVIDDTPKHETVEEWISVKDRLPELDTNVIVSDGNALVTEMRYSSNKYARNPKPRFEWHGRVNYPWTISHWQPLPEPPEERDE